LAKLDKNMTCFLSFRKMTDDRQVHQSEKYLMNLLLANSGWKVVYNVGDRYFIEEIIAYAFIKTGNYYELIPLTLPDVYLGQSLNEYILKDGYVGLINPQNELIANDLFEEGHNQINLQKIKEALTKNRYQLD
jgi:hypothetical protein